MIDKLLLKKLKKERKFFKSWSAESLVFLMFLILITAFIAGFVFQKDTLMLLSVSLTGWLVFILPIVWDSFESSVKEIRREPAVDFLLRIKNSINEDDYRKFFDYIQLNNYFNKDINECFEECEKKIIDDRDRKLAERERKIKKKEEEKLKEEENKKILLATMARKDKK